MYTFFKCPTCHKPLIKYEKFYSCENIHMFDISSNGFLNMPIKHRRGSKTNAYHKTRKALLESGMYSHLANEICEIIKNNLNGKSLVADLSCREGYFCNSAAENNPEAVFAAFDSSASALKLFERKYDNVYPALSQSSSLPLFDNSVDIAINIRKPVCTKELSRILSDDGIVINVTAGENYFRELRPFGLPKIEESPISCLEFYHDATYMFSKRVLISKENYMSIMRIYLTEKELMECYGFESGFVTSEFKIEILRKRKSFKITNDKIYKSVKRKGS